MQPQVFKPQTEFHCAKISNKEARRDATEQQTPLGVSCISVIKSLKSYFLAQCQSTMRQTLLLLIKKHIKPNVVLITWWRNPPPPFKSHKTIIARRAAFTSPSSTLLPELNSARWLSLYEMLKRNQAADWLPPSCFPLASSLKAAMVCLGDQWSTGKQAVRAQSILYVPWDAEVEDVNRRTGLVSIWMINADSLLIDNQCRSLCDCESYS